MLTDRGGVASAERTMPTAQSAAKPVWPHSPANDHRPLAGVKVLDLSRIVAGPLCAMTLADLGADVVKVEGPAGDEVRRWGPPFHADTATYYSAVNRNKWSVVLDLKSSPGRQAMLALAGEADVVISNFGGAVATALGADFASISAVNPRVIYVSISGYGPQHPDKPGFDLVAQASSGLMSVTGPADGEPSKVGVPISDITAAHYATIAVLAQLAGTRAPVAPGAIESRRAVKLEVSLQDAALSLLSNQSAGWLLAESVPARRGNDHPNVAPYGVFATRDGAIAIGAGTDGQFGQLCAAIGVPDLARDVRYADNRSRIANLEALTEAVEDALSTRDTESWGLALDTHGVPNGPIREVPDALAAADRDLIQDVDSTQGRLRLTVTPIRTDGTFPTHYLPPPWLGEHTAAVFGSASTEQL